MRMGLWRVQGTDKGQARLSPSRMCVEAPDKTLLNSAYKPVRWPLRSRKWFV